MDYKKNGGSKNGLSTEWIIQEELLDAKGVGLFDGEQELLVEHLGGAVGREVEPVETGVSPARKEGRVSIFCSENIKRW